MAERDRLKLFTGVTKAPPYADVVYTALGLIKPPSITFQDIHNFLIERKREDNEESSVSSYRTMDRAVAHFQAGDVQEIKFSQVDTDLMYGTALVLASMKKIRYRVYICFQDKPVHALCECPIGLAQYCSHIGSLLFAISNHNITADHDVHVSCTSKKSTWNVPRKMVMEPKPLKELRFNKPKQNDNNEFTDAKAKVLGFDPRHSSQKTLDCDHYTTKMMELRAILPNTGMAHLAPIPDETPYYETEETIKTSSDQMQEKAKGLIYKADTSTAYLITPIEENLSQYIEEQTRGQRDNELWRELHKGRLTSSAFGDIIRAGQAPNNLIYNILNGSSMDRYHSLPKAVKWGIEHEADALADYILLQNRVKTLNVTKSGLVLYPPHPYLGASSDGRVTDHSMSAENRHGVLEIKCPFSLHGQEIHNMEVHKIVEMGDKDFCLQMTEHGPRLRRDHKYYAQVQGEMAMIGVTWCDFVVWTSATKNNCFIERIVFDHEFVLYMLPKLRDFFAKNILHD